MKHWHLRKPKSNSGAYKKVTHTHDGGGKRHAHPKENLVGYGKSAHTVKVSRGDMSLGQLATGVMGVAVISSLTKMIK